MLVFLYVLWKTPLKRNAIALLLFMTGIGFLFEFIILVLLRSYEYDPDLLSNWYYDNLMGAIASDAFSLPAIATYVAVFRLAPIWFFVFAGVFYGVEKVFTDLNVYHHFWWRTYYTSIALVLYFWIAKTWLRKLQLAPTRLTRTIMIYFISFPLVATMQFALTGIFGTHRFVVGLFENLERDQVTGATLYCLVFAACITLTIRLSDTWKGRMLVIIGLVGFNLLLDQTRFLEVKKEWYYLAVGLHIFAQTLLLPFLDRSFPADPKKLQLKH